MTWTAAGLTATLVVNEEGYFGAGQCFYVGKKASCKLVECVPSHCIDGSDLSENIGMFLHASEIKEIIWTTLRLFIKFNPTS